MQDSHLPILQWSGVTRYPPPPRALILWTFGTKHTCTELTDGLTVAVAVDSPQHLPTQPTQRPHVHSTSHLPPSTPYASKNTEPGDEDAQCTGRRCRKSWLMWSRAHGDSGMGILLAAQSPAGDEGWSVGAWAGEGLGWGSEQEGWIRHQPQSAARSLFVLRLLSHGAMAEQRTVGFSAQQ
jgi:hypothetical protein